MRQTRGDQKIHKQTREKDHMVITAIQKIQMNDVI